MITNIPNGYEITTAHHTAKIYDGQVQVKIFRKDIPEVTSEESYFDMQIAMAESLIEIKKEIKKKMERI